MAARVLERRLRLPPGLRGGGGSPGWLLERLRDLGATGRAERPSLLPLLAPLSARRATVAAAPCGCVFVKGGGSERDAGRRRKEPRHGAGCIAKAGERAPIGVVQRESSWGTVGVIVAER